MSIRRYGLRIGSLHIIWWDLWKRRPCFAIEWWDGT